MATRVVRTALAALLSAMVLTALADGPFVGIGPRPKPVTIPCAVDTPATVTGGSTVQCTVSVNQVVDEDQVVAMQTDHPEVYSGFPQNVVVSSGHDSVTFDLTTVTVSGC
ncbi:MAG: hypothetical protein FJX72_09275, partial [Armatimonadetes bacterium]|nr:hypothetical protein [Armatimonadota bacterium]